MDNLGLGMQGGVWCGSGATLPTSNVLQTDLQRIAAIVLITLCTAPLLVLFAVVGLKFPPWPVIKGLIRLLNGWESFVAFVAWIPFLVSTWLGARCPSSEHLAQLAA